MKTNGGRKAYDSRNNADIVENMQKMKRYTFPGNSINTNDWVVKQVGTGANVSVNVPELIITTGTNTNSETIIESVESFTIPSKIGFYFMISQKIANQEFYFEMVSVDSNGDVDDEFGCAWKFAYGDNAGATYAITQAWENGQPRNQSTALAYGSNIAYGIIWEINATDEDLYFFAKSGNSINVKGLSSVFNTYALDPVRSYKIRIRTKNLASAPASTTSFKCRFATVSDYTNMHAEITGSRGSAMGAESLPVNVIGNVPVTATISGTPAVSITAISTANGQTNGKLICAATTNPTAIKASVGRLYRILATNTSGAVVYLKLYNKSSAPTVGTDVPVMTIPIPAGQMVNLINDSYGISFSSGIALAVTTGYADADTGALATLGSVIINYSYI